MKDSIIIDRRFNGPADSANGGYTSGLLASQLDAETVEVTLRTPPPLDTPLTLQRNGATVLAMDGETLIAEATPSDVDVMEDVPAPISYEDAVIASIDYQGYKSHPFPSCVVCGPGREHDGLRLFPGRVRGRDIHAVAWIPEQWTSAGDGVASAALVWAVLDCTGGWATDPDPDRPAMLGRITARLLQPAEVGKRYVVYGWPIGIEGRKMFSGTALTEASGRLVAAARSTWIRVGADALD